VVNRVPEPLTLAESTDVVIVPVIKLMNDPYGDAVAKGEEERRFPKTTKHRSQR